MQRTSRNMNIAETDDPGQEGLLYTVFISSTTRNRSNGDVPKDPIHQAFS